MKFLCCSDTHGRVPPALDEQGATAWLHAGDVYNCLKLGRKPEGRNDFDKMKSWLAQRPIPVYASAGNHDCMNPCNFDMCYDVDIAKITPKLSLVRIGWHNEKFDDIPMESTIAKVVERAMRTAYRSMKDGDHSILLCHWPPSLPPNSIPGIELKQEHGWIFRSVEMMVDALRPSAAIFGHLHQMGGARLPSFLPT